MCCPVLGLLFDFRVREVRTKDTHELCKEACCRTLLDGNLAHLWCLELSALVVWLFGSGNQAVQSPMKFSLGSEAISV